MVKYFISISISLLLISCFPKRFNKKHFVFDYDIAINEIMTEGYYFSIYDLNQDYHKYKGQNIRMRVFLRNGYTYFVKNGFGDLCGNVISLECAISKSEYMFDRNLNEFLPNASEIKRNKVSLWNWGKFDISNDTIKIQWYYNRFGDYFLIEEKGVIIDSVSFRIFSVKDYRSKEEEEKNEVYYFKPYEIQKIYEKIPPKL